eukprot:scaffold4827_cov269-Prasinococcus_capsulatus_cf.AAC.1
MRRPAPRWRRPGCGCRRLAVRRRHRHRRRRRRHRPRRRGGSRGAPTTNKRRGLGRWLPSTALSRSASVPRVARARAASYLLAAGAASRASASAGPPELPSTPRWPRLPAGWRGLAG